MNDLTTIDAELVPTNSIETKTAYTTAMTTIKPRNLSVVTNRVLEEANIAGDEFYYSWKQGGSIIEGLTINAAIAIARNMGNCAIPVTIEETKDSYIFTATYIDLETGFNLQRSFRQNKQSPKNKQGKDIYKGDRGKDIVFQIGQSKAIRNVILNAVPSWLSKKALEKAKENVFAKIENMGIEKAKDKVIKKANALKISIEAIEETFGKSWDTTKIVQIVGALKSVEDGLEKAEDVFVMPKEDKKPKPSLNDIPKHDEVTGEVMEEIEV